MDPPAAVGRQRHHLHPLQRPPERRPGAAAGGPARGAGDPPGHPRDLRARPAALRPVPGLHQARLPGVRLRALLPQRRRRALAAARPPAEHALPDRRRRRRLADRRAHRRHDLRRQARLVPRPLLHDHGARGDLRAGLLARARRRSTSSPRTSGASRSCPARAPSRTSASVVHEGRGADHAVVRARDRVRGDLRPPAARQPARGAGGGLHPHRARQGRSPSGA